MEFKQALSRAGLSKSSFARLVGLKPRTVYRWEEPPAWVLAYLELMAEVRELRARTAILDRLSQTLIDSDFRR